MSKQTNLIETDISGFIQKKIHDQNFNHLDMAQISQRKNINLSNYYNTKISYEDKISFEITTETKKKKLSEVMFDIPFFIKDTDFFSKYEYKMNLITQRDLGMTPNNIINSNIKKYLFPYLTKYTNDKENDPNLANLNQRKDLEVISDISLNLNLKVNKKKGLKTENCNGKFSNQKNSYQSNYKSFAYKQKQLNN